MLFKLVLLLTSIVFGVSALSKTDWQIELNVVSDDSDVDTLLIKSDDEGASANYLFLDKYFDSYFRYSPEEHKLYDTKDGQVRYFTIENNLATFGDYNPNLHLDFPEVTLEVNGSSDHFYACKHVLDPYDISATKYAIAYSAQGTPPFSDCKSVKVTINSASG